MSICGYARGISKLACFFVLFIVLAGISTAADFEDITGNIGIGAVFTCIEGVRGTDRVYAGTRYGLYSTRDYGMNWKREDLPPGKFHVTGIAFSGENIFVSSVEGLLVSGPPHGKWERLPGQKGLKGVVPMDHSGNVVTWTGTDIFLVEDNRWNRILTTADPGEIEDVVVVSGVIYAARGGDIFYSDNAGRGWQRYFVTARSPEETSHEFSEEEGEEASLPPIRALHPADPGILISSDAGVFFFDALTGRAEHITTTGISRSGAMRAVKTDGKFIVASENRLFLRDSRMDTWRAVFSSGGEGAIVDLDLHTGGSGPEGILVAAGRRIYRGALSGGEKRSESGTYAMGFPPLSAGPDITEVHRMAIEYAEVSPDKIRRWREAARWKAVFPRLTVAFSEDHRDNIEFYKSANTSYLLSGPRKRNNDWRVNMVWDLSDIIWNGAQTSIDVRSRLMVQLRVNILEDITRLYFERKKLIKEVGAIAEEDAARLEAGMLRIEELTAYIDAYTGGEFSRN